MSERHYVIDVTIDAEGHATLLFGKSDADGTRSRLTDPYEVESKDGFTDALGLLANEVEDARVEFWNDDEDEAESGPDEPPKGSVVLIHGPSGTAFQRFFDTGKWYAAGDGGDGILWHEVVSENNDKDPIVVYTPKED